MTLGDVTGAVACWRQAGDLCADPALALEYAAAAADALADAGRLPEAVAAYAALAADAPPETRRWVHDRMLLASYVSGLEPLDRPDGGDAPGGTASISTAFALANKSLAADRVAVLARTAAQDALEGRLPVRSLLLSTALLAAASAFDDADRLLSDAVDAPRDPQTALIAAACRGLVRVRVGRVTEGLADLERAGAHPAAAGPAQEVAQVSAVVDGLLARGDLAGATRLSAGLNRIPQSTGIAAALARHTLAEVAGAAGDHVLATRAVPRRRAVHRCGRRQPRAAPLAGRGRARRDPVGQRRPGPRARPGEPPAGPAVRRAVRRGAGAAHGRRRRRDRGPGRAAAPGASTSSARSRRCGCGPRSRPTWPRCSPSPRRTGPRRWCCSARWTSTPPTRGSSRSGAAPGASWTASVSPALRPGRGAGHPDRGRAAHRPAGRGGALQPVDRRAARGEREGGRVAPVRLLPQARHPVAAPARRPCSRLPDRPGTAPRDP